MIRIALLAMMLPLAVPAIAADGQQAYAAQCRMCHGANGAGGPLAPSLVSVAGRKIASSKFGYSAALKATDGNWTDANLDAWLKAPSKFALASKMITSVPDNEKRAAIIAYLKMLK